MHAPLKKAVRRHQAPREIHEPAQGPLSATYRPPPHTPLYQRDLGTCPHWRNRGWEGERRYHTGKWLQEGPSARQTALLTAGGWLQSRSSSRALSLTFASLSPSTLGTVRVSLCTASNLFPSRKTTAPSSIPSCKRNKDPLETQHSEQILPAQANNTFSGSRIRPIRTLKGHSFKSPRDL